MNRNQGGRVVPPGAEGEDEKLKKNGLTKERGRKGGAREAENPAAPGK